MPHDIIGEWDLVDTTKGKDAPLGRIAFLEQDRALVVRSADPEVTDRPARVEVDGWTLRFELLSAGSSRGNAHHAYELSMHGADAFSGTRRRGLLPKTPVTGYRVTSPVTGLAEAPVLPAQPDQLASLTAVPGGVAEAKAKAAEAAERASLAAAEAAAALAEAEAAAAMEAARRAAETAAAARAAVWTPMPEPVAAAPQPPVLVVPQQQAPAPAAPSVVPVPRQDPLPPTALANLPAPAAQPHAFVPAVTNLATDVAATPAPAAPAVSDATEEITAISATGTHLLRITHGLTGGDRTALAAEVFPGLFVWGNSFLTPEHRLREVGWVATPIVTDETIEVDGLLLQYAALVRDSLAD